MCGSVTYSSWSSDFVISWRLYWKYWFSVTQTLSWNYIWQWPIFHGPVILPCILKTIWWTNICSCVCVEFLGIKKCFSVQITLLSKWISTLVSQCYFTEGKVSQEVTALSHTGKVLCIDFDTDWCHLYTLYEEHQHNYTGSQIYWYL